MLKKIPSDKVHGTKIALFFLQALTRHIYF